MRQYDIESAAALIVIDVQNGFDHPSRGRRNNPRAEAKPIFHIKHNSTNPESAYRPGQSGNDFKPRTRPLPGEAVVGKTTNSAFIGTAIA